MNGNSGFFNTSETWVTRWYTKKTWCNNIWVQLGETDRHWCLFQAGVNNRFWTNKEITAGALAILAHRVFFALIISSHRSVRIHFFGNHCVF
jgi:hypothetical protein